jgi:hypothetical protein
VSGSQCTSNSTIYSRDIKCTGGSRIQPFSITCTRNGRGPSRLTFQLDHYVSWRGLVSPFSKRLHRFPSLTTHSERSVDPQGQEPSSGPLHRLQLAVWLLLSYINPHKPFSSATVARWGKGHSIRGVVTTETAR